MVAAVVVMEDSPLFNAGRGAVYNADARHELDAAVMEGATLGVGAVTCVSRIRNPVLAARAVMEHSPHVLLAGRGAERFARRQGLEIVPESYFDTRRRLAALKKLQRSAAEGHGSVGVVALDTSGNLAAATSTGGHTGKMPVGDSPIIGAGAYADNRLRGFRHRARRGVHALRARLRRCRANALSRRIAPARRRPRFEALSASAATADWSRSTTGV